MYSAETVPVQNEVYEYWFPIKIYLSMYLQLFKLVHIGNYIKI